MSRVYRIGNIYTRVEGLIRKNYLNRTDRPLWFDIYEQFPPKYNPNFKRAEREMTVRKIFYKEDALRAKIHKAFEDHLGVFNFQDNKNSFSQSLLKSCLEYISQGMSEVQAIEKLKASFNVQKINK